MSYRLFTLLYVSVLSQITKYISEPSKSVCCIKWFFDISSDFIHLKLYEQLQWELNQQNTGVYVLTVISYSEWIKHTTENDSKYSACFSRMSCWSTITWTLGFKFLILAAAASALYININRLILKLCTFWYLMLPTFCPMLASVKKNCAPKSNSVTVSWSSNVMLATPANAIFLHTSSLNARMPAIRILALPILLYFCRTNWN